MQRTTDTSANLTNQAIRGRSVCQRWLLAAGRKRSLPEHRERRSNAAAVARTEADLRDAVERSACPTEAAKGVALDRTNRTDATHKSYVSYVSYCMVIGHNERIRTFTDGASEFGSEMRLAKMPMPSHAATTRTLSSTTCLQVGVSMRRCRFTIAKTSRFNGA